MGYLCGLFARGYGYNNYNNRRNFNANRRPDNGLGMVFAYTMGFILMSPMKTYQELYPALCSYENLEFAFRKARKGKTLKDYVIEFESELKNNLLNLQHELESQTYAPAPLTTFIVRDPKTRKISASHFSDRVVHHALCNIIEPILEKEFIHDSFANQKGKGTHKAIMRFEKFVRKVSSNYRNPTTSGGGNANFLEVCIQPVLH